MSRPRKRADLAAPATRNNPPGVAPALRREAEKALQRYPGPSPDDTETMAPEAIRQALHELRVQQIELEMAKEELRRTQGALATARTRCFELYDLAQCGY